MSFPSDPQLNTAYSIGDLEHRLEEIQAELEKQRQQLEAAGETNEAIFRTLLQRALSEGSENGRTPTVPVGRAGEEPTHA